MAQHAGDKNTEYGIPKEIETSAGPKEKVVRKKIVHLKSCTAHQNGDNGSLKAI